MAFNEDYSKLEYAWRITSFDFSDEESLIIGVNSDYNHNVENMREFEITEKIKFIFNNWLRNINIPEKDDCQKIKDRRK